MRHLASYVSEVVIEVAYDRCVLGKARSGGGFARRRSTREACICGITGIRPYRHADATSPKGTEMEVPATEAGNGGGGGASPCAETSKLSASRVET
ncbi:MAG: hypothetical protein ACKPKO_49920, partial [Candidatus Fonsibacter sp.]